MATFIGTFEQIHEGMFGRSQHDAHVTRRRQAMWHRSADKFLDEADKRVAAEVQSMIADMRAKRAPQLSEAAE